MSEKQLESNEFFRQARLHLESLRAAGVEWLPGPRPRSERETAGRPSPTSSAKGLPPAEPSTTSSPQVASPTSFFEDAKAPTPPVASSASSLTIDQRRQELTVLAEQIRPCTRCTELVKNRTQTVFGVGNPGVELCFIGEAPGEDEDRQGEPFVGRAGQLLNKIIIACGMKREEVYICNICKCRPPSNRTPLPNEAANCREYLDRQLELVAPKFICAMGACAAQNLLQTTDTIGRLRGRFHNYRGITVMCTYHPAYLLRTESAKKDVWEDMKKLMAQMGRTVPPVK